MVISPNIIIPHIHVVNDLEPDYDTGPDIEDQPIPLGIQGLTNNRKGKYCPLCCARFAHVNRHVIKDNLFVYER